MPDDNINPCRFKKNCISCKFVAEFDRPMLCARMACEFYSPCAGCNMNKNLNDEHLCSECASVTSLKPSRKVTDVNSKSIQSSLLEKGTAILPGKESSVSFPGIPHKDYTDDERRYYTEQWSQYSGFYRDPSAYTICHHLIMLEIELGNVTGKLVTLRADSSFSAIKEFEDRQARIIANIKSLRAQLPEKDAASLTDDEKAMASILEKYTEQKKYRYKGGVSRILSNEAIALAPVLHFKIDARKLLEKLGYQIEDIEKAVDRMAKSEELPSDIMEIVEFFGMPVRESLANPGKASKEINDFSPLASSPFEVDDEEPPQITSFSGDE